MLATWPWQYVISIWSSFLFWFLPRLMVSLKYQIGRLCRLGKIVRPFSQDVRGGSGGQLRGRVVKFYAATTWSKASLQTTRQTTRQDTKKYLPCFLSWPCTTPQKERLHLKAWKLADKDILLFGWQHLSLTHGTMLSMPQSTIMGIINVMLDIAAMLRLLVLHNGVSLAASHPLLPSMTSPVFLILKCIPNLVYFSPGSAIA